MAELKTKLNDASVEKFLNAVTDKGRRDDCFKVMELMKKVTKKDAKMWGTAIVGFGSYTYKYSTGKTGDWPLVGFSPRKQALTVYIMAGFKRYPELMKNLGKVKVSGGSCLYIRKLEDVDMKTLKELVTESVKYLKNKKW
jgi:hypothetical protein